MRPSTLATLATRPPVRTRQADRQATSTCIVSSIPVSYMCVPHTFVQRHTKVSWQATTAGWTRVLSWIVHCISRFVKECDFPVLVNGRDGRVLRRTNRVRVHLVSDYLPVRLHAHGACMEERKSTTLQ